MIDDLLDKTLDVERSKTTKSATGAKKKDFGWNTRHAAVPCTFWPASAQTRADYGKLDQVAEFEFCTETNIEATTEDRIACEGRYYAVLGYKPYDNSAFGEPLYITVCGRRNQVTTPAT